MIKTAVGRSSYIVMQPLHRLEVIINSKWQFSWAKQPFERAVAFYKESLKQATEKLNSKRIR